MDEHKITYSTYILLQLRARTIHTHTIVRVNAAAACNVIRPADVKAVFVVKRPSRPPYPRVVIFNYARPNGDSGTESFVLWTSAGTGGP